MKGWVGLVGWPIAVNGRFTHINGHPSAISRVQDRESSPAKDRHLTFPAAKRRLPFTGLYQIILLGVRVTRVWTACSESLRRRGVKLATTFWSQVRHSTRYVTSLKRCMRDTISFTSWPRHDAMIYEIYLETYAISTCLAFWLFNQVYVGVTPVTYATLAFKWNNDRLNSTKYQHYDDHN